MGLGAEYEIENLINKFICGDIGTSLHASDNMSIWVNVQGERINYSDISDSYFKNIKNFIQNRGFEVPPNMKSIMKEKGIWKS